MRGQPRLRTKSAYIIGLVLAIASMLAVSFYVFEPRTALISCAFGGAMLAIAASDSRSYVIPDILSLPSIPAGLIATYWLTDAGERAQVVLIHVGAASMGAAIFLGIRLIYRMVRHRDGLGLGDVKLAAVAGAWTGFSGLSQVMLLSCILAFLVVAIVNFRHLKSLEGTLAIPFGTYLAPSIWFVWCSQMLGTLDALS